MSAASSMLDPGPMARLREVCADASTVSVIAQRVAGGETLRAVCRAWDIPHGAMLAWMMADDARWGTYRNALVAAGFAHADAAIEIADAATEDDVQVAKLRSDVRRWSAAKNASEFFGEKIDVTVRRALPSEAALMAQLDALIAGRPGLLDQLLERRARLAAPVTEQVPPAAPASTQGA